MQILKDLSVSANKPHACVPETLEYLTSGAIKLVSVHSHCQTKTRPHNYLTISSSLAEVVIYCSAASAFDSGIHVLMETHFIALPGGYNCALDSVSLVDVIVISQYMQLIVSSPVFGRYRLCPWYAVAAQAYTLSSESPVIIRAYRTYPCLF